MKTKTKPRIYRSVQSSGGGNSGNVRSQAIRERARDILRTMPKELKELCDQLSKY